VGLPGTSSGFRGCCPGGGGLLSFRSGRLEAVPYCQVLETVSDHGAGPSGGDLGLHLDTVF